jgi:type VI secretion system secreted protein VgrG
MALKQETRLLGINTPLGSDVIGVREISVQERLGRPFRIDAELSSEKDIEFDKLLGNNVTLRLVLGDKKVRYFNGFVSRLSQGANKGKLTQYRAEIVPWLWFLTRTSDCRIFQQKSVPEILETVFQGHGFSDFELRLSETYEKKDFCVQYRETDFNFVSRLMEQEGIYYFVEHQDGKNLLVLADSISAHSPTEGCEKVAFNVLERGGTNRDTISDWTMEREVQAVAYAHTDFNPLTPSTSLVATSSITRQHGGANFELYDYPGEYAKHAEGTRLTDVRLEEQSVHFETFRGMSNVRGLMAGATFTLEKHPVAALNKDYLITGTTIHIKEGEFASGQGGDGQPFIACGIEAIDKAQTFRAARITPKPVIQGLQTAWVTGPSGEEIHTDEHGRVKLHFHWDRYQKADENSSCWVRVASTSAGKQWGAISLPRIGQEVIVEFLEGDPDRPIVTGRVYNAENMPPYALPGEKTKSTIKTNSSKGGEGFNEVRFEDKKGSEQLFIHGEKDQDIRIKNDCKEWIGHDRHLVVKNDQVESVENDRHEKIKRDHIEDIGRDRHTKIGGKAAIGINETLSLKVTGDVGMEFASNLHTKVTKDVLIEGKNIVLKASENITLKIGEDEIYIAMSKDGIKLSAANKEIAIESKDINSKATGNVKTEATMEASIKGTQALKLEGTAQAEMKGAQTTVKGDAMLTISGGMVKIN